MLFRSLLKYARKDRISNLDTNDGRGTTVPFHQGRDISPRLLRQIASDIDLTIEELLKFR